jgi:hypothetical protein
VSRSVPMADGEWAAAADRARRQVQTEISSAVSLVALGDWVHGAEGTATRTARIAGPGSLVLWWIIVRRSREEHQAPVQMLRGWGGNPGEWEAMWAGRIEDKDAVSFWLSRVTSDLKLLLTGYCPCLGSCEQHDAVVDAMAREGIVPT